MSFQRASGILLHPTSLPGPFGIGDLGQSAYEFIDFLERSGQRLWQVLPLGPTGYDHSPYTMNFSAFAGNPLLISLEQLVADGLLQPQALTPLNDADPNAVDFERVIAHKRPLLEQAFEQFRATGQAQAELAQFCQAQAWWLADFVLFMALLEANEGRPWSQWERAIAQRQPEALAAQTTELAEQVQFHQFVQFIFFQQWGKLRAYCRQKNIEIVGDVSIYVCHNSADVWANPGLFKLDAQTLEPAYIAGVPPDYFSATGQLWGNPVYDWDACQRTGYDWWVKRFKATLQYVDIVRVDHFRGFEAYWQVPAGESTAINGEWVKAPGEDFFKTLGDCLGSLPIMAEDLGIITPEVDALRDRFDFPGMKILMFAFNEGSRSSHLPHHYPRNSVVYPGTHDNDTVLGWWQSLDPSAQQFLAAYFGYSGPAEVSQINWLLIRVALASTADLAVIALQDVLDLGGEARMNDPSKIPGNWRWRYVSSAQLSPERSDRLAQLTALYSR
jgi:4-alpha-glucanotransferase